MTNSVSTLEKNHSKLTLALLFIRLGIGLVFLMWTLDKFINPEHTAAVFKHFYNIDNIAFSSAYILGGVQLILVIAFICGAFKKYSYSLVLILHAVSTFGAYAKYMDPWSNLLFFAAFPMLAGCWALWSVRELDTKFSFDDR